MFSKLVVFFAIAALGIVAFPTPLTAEQRDFMLDVHNHCMKVSGATDDMAADAMDGIFPDVPALKKLILCGAQKMGFISDSGELFPDIIKQKVMMFAMDEADKIDGAVNLCAVKKETPEDTIFEMSRCLYKVQREGK